VLVAIAIGPEAVHMGEGSTVPPPQVGPGPQDHSL
jgi:hypothetical protein